MPRFQFNAVDAAGRSVAATIDAASLAQAVARLEAEGLRVDSITLDATDPGPVDPALVEAAERLAHCGAGIIEPLTAYVKEAPAGRRRGELQAIAKTLSLGDSSAVCRAVAAEPVAWAPLLAAATEPATLDKEPPSVFARFVNREQPLATVRRRSQLAMAYPVFVVGLVMLIAWPIATMILPEFREIYKDFGLELPGFTLFVLAMGNFIERGGGWLLLVGLVATAVWMATPRWAPAGLTRWLEWLKSIGEGQDIAKARLARHVADLIEARLPIAESLRLASRDAGDAVGRLAQRVHSDLERPHAVGSLGYALKVDTPAESRVRLLRELAACHNECSTGRASWAEGVVGPLTIVLLGVVVGGVVLALFLPLVSLVEGLT